MRYIKHYLTEIAGIEIYPIISLLIFSIFFLGLFVYVFTMKKKHSEYMGMIPLEEGAGESIEEMNL